MAPIAASLMTPMAGSLMQPFASSLINTVSRKEVMRAGKKPVGGYLPLSALPFNVKFWEKESQEQEEDITT